MQGNREGIKNGAEEDQEEKQRWGEEKVWKEKTRNRGRAIQDKWDRQKMKHAGH